MKKFFLYEIIYFRYKGFVIFELEIFYTSSLVSIISTSLCVIFYIFDNISSPLLQFDQGKGEEQIQTYPISSEFHPVAPSRDVDGVVDWCNFLWPSTCTNFFTSKWISLFAKISLAFTVKFHLYLSSEFFEHLII